MKPRARTQTKPSRGGNSRSSPKRHPGLHYNRAFVSKPDRAAILDWISTLHPIWEYRYSKHNPPPHGESQRQLLRPVYWLGNWQFACLNYYHPPKGIENRCVLAEPFPPVLAKLASRIEEHARRMFHGPDLPAKWHLNTCLVNFYGSKIEDGKHIDTARVGEHKDFEPGPVGSISLGERALFQFVTSSKRGSRDGVVLQQWLDDGSLQIFGGHRWKNQCFHRVQRVDRRDGHHFPIQVENFEVRRLNFTFRYVPVDHILRFAALPSQLREDVKGYMETLARHSEYFQRELRLAEDITKDISSSP